MPRANFDDDQFLASTGPFKAKGPTGQGETLLWVWVWITQNRQGTAAAARGGTAGPFTGTWEVPLTMASPGDAFVADRRARGHAVALVEVGDDNEPEVYWWSEPIWLRP
jgi:hypothetical protein